MDPELRRRPDRANGVTDSVVATKQQQFSQELRLASRKSGAIEYTAGLYFFWQEANDRTISLYGRDAVGWLLTPNNPTAPVSALPSSVLDGLTACARVIPATYSYASYGQATWNASPVFASPPACASRTSTRPAL